jgi:hypothetical protein
MSIDRRTEQGTREMHSNVSPAKKRNRKLLVWEAKMLLVIAPLAVAVILAVRPTSVLAGSFDGNWVALIPPQGECNRTSVMTLTLSGNTFQGQTRNPRGTEAFSGKIDAEGNGTFLVFPRFPGIIKFTADHFDANWNNDACSRHALGDRALTSTETAAAFAARKQFQAEYADLAKRVSAGDKSVDLTALRAAYPYTDQWDPFGNRTAALLDQAAAASKGKDCVTALEKLDQILKLDFTIDAAHALRSDCLTETGNETAAKIESDIADGLIHSLMDSGDGNTEVTAYVVVTEREEMDVLANRHLVTKVRQTEVRGHDGHIYDEVQGTSARRGASISTVYFDVSSFANGRKSRMAAIDTLTFAMP